MADKQPKKINITSPDLNAARLDDLRRLMPDLFTGEGQLDEQALRQLVQPHHQAGTERFRFEWAGKQESKRQAFTPSRATLIADKERSVDFDNTQNLIIEGENLEVLKLLQATYFEQVKCIYIDPPYNTGNDFIYPDNFAETKAAYWQKNGTIQNGVKLVANSETSGRKHSNWLNMMQARLLLARQLLREDGVIFISIDDNEVHNLRKLCDEVFGEESFVHQISWESKTKSQNTQDAYRKLQPKVEYILVYFKNIKIPFNLIKTGKKEYPCCDDKGEYREFIMEEMSSAGLRSRATMFFEINGVWPKKGRRWQMGIEEVNKLKERGDVEIRAGKVVLRRRPDDERGTVTEPFWGFLSKEIGTAESAKKELSKIVEGHGFETIKPLALIKRLCFHATDKDSILLDFFAGSGTTGDAVMSQNSEDGGHRRYIMVQIPEYTEPKDEAHKASGYKTISSLCIERVKRAGEQINKDNPKAKVDTGFRVYRLANSHFPENLFTSDPNKSEEENKVALKEHLLVASQFNLFNDDDLADIITEISLDNGYGLFFTLEQTKDGFTGNTVYRLSGNGKDTLLCLDAKLEAGTVETLIGQHSEDQLIVSKQALTTTKNWELKNALGDNLRII